MTHYLFYQAGYIPGLPGIYGNCRVDIAQDGTITQSPLSIPPHDGATALPDTPVAHLEILAQEVQEALAEVQQEQPSSPPVEHTAGQE